MKTLVDREELVSSPPELGCVLYLPGLPGGGSKIHDRSPYGNVGTITGATWKILPSGLYYLDFDGSDDYVNCGNSPGMNFTSEDFTFKCWIKPGSPLQDGTIVTRGYWQTDGWWVRFRSLGSVQMCTFQSGVNQSTLSPDGDLSAGNWYNIVVTRSGSSVRSYINTERRQHLNGSHIDPASSTRTLKLGCRDNIASPWFYGAIALVGIYNRAWSPFEVQNNFHREKDLFGVWSR